MHTSFRRCSRCILQCISLDVFDMPATGSSHGRGGKWSKEESWHGRWKDKEARLCPPIAQAVFGPRTWWWHLGGSRVQHNGNDHALLTGHLFETEPWLVSLCVCCCDCVCVLEHRCCAVRFALWCKVLPCSVKRVVSSLLCNV